MKKERFNYNQSSDENFLRKISVTPDISIKNTIKIINSTSFQVAVVVDKKEKYLGIVTDGDIRRGLINNITINQKINKIYNKKTITLRQNKSTTFAKELMKKKKIEHLPILNKNKNLTGIHFKENFYTKTNFMNPVILMAGGKGKRMRPLTFKIPKPMIKLKNIPILEHIILKLKKEKFKNFYIAVNYLKEKIIKYFKNGEKYNVNIAYIKEAKPLGTAGSIKMLDNKLNLPIIICNGDVLSKVNAESILKFHNLKKSFATMGVIEYEHRNPFGVISAKNFNFLSIKEKPIKKYYVSAGIYVLNSEVVKFLKPNTKIDMPELFKKLKKKKLKTLIFPIHEKWKDIGKIEDLKIFK